jgi:hypothetical protein
MQKQSRLTTYILLGLGLGILTGYYAHDHLANPVGFADTMSLVTTLFLRLIKMIIAPLVFSTLVVGIARMGDASEVGRIGIKALGWFLIASIMSLSLGLILVNLFRPGDALLATWPPMPPPRPILGHHLRPEPEGFVTHLVPSSIVDGMAKNEILQIVIFSLFFGTGAAAVGAKRHAADRRHRRRRPRHAQSDRLRDELRTGGRVRGSRRRDRQERPGCAVDLRRVHGRVLPRHRAAVGVLIFIGFLFLGPRLRQLMREMRGPTCWLSRPASSEAAFQKPWKAWSALA